MTKITTQSLRQVRFYQGNEYSKQIGYKGRLVTIDQARRIVKRLRRAGIEAFHVSFKIKVARAWSGETARQRVGGTFGS